MNVERKQIKEMGSLLEFLVDLEDRKRRMWEKELETMPAGRLGIVHRNDKVYFQLAAEGRRRGITKDIQLVYKLARKRYLQLMVKEKKDEFLRVYKYKNEKKRNKLPAKQALKRKNIIKSKMSPVEKLLDRYGKAGLNILRITCSEAQYRWITEEYRKNTKNPEELIYETYSGIKVRSKSEQTIGNELEVRGIPYRYEPEISLEVGWMDGIAGGTFGQNGRRYKQFYPDFVILTATGEYIFWEHLGRVDLEGYRAHNMEKIAAYRQGGKAVCEDWNLVLTFERDLTRLETLNEIITNRIMPYL